MVKQWNSGHDKERNRFIRCRGQDISCEEQLDIDLLLIFSIQFVLAFANGEKETGLFDVEDILRRTTWRWSPFLFLIQYVLAFANGEKETGLFDVVEDRISYEEQLDIDLLLLFPILVPLVLLLAFAKGEEERSREEHLDNPTV